MTDTIEKPKTKRELVFEWHAACCAAEDAKAALRNAEAIERRTASVLASSIAPADMKDGELIGVWLPLTANAMVESLVIVSKDHGTLSVRLRR